jgi:hypothetical protein
MSRPKKETTVEMTSAFLTMLDNEEVITKLASALSASLNLIFEEN